MAEAAGFDSIFISDHFHPWVDTQGNSPFVWSVIGAIAATTRQRVMTGVTCPIGRIHPVVLAQAAATSQLLLDGRFVFGIGTGEALNEHITGEKWPPPPVRLERLREAVEILRELWGGRMVSYRGEHFTVENARLYSCPETPPPIPISAFGPQSLELAAEIGDGLVTTHPSEQDVKDYRAQGGSGPIIGALKVCYASDEQAARSLAHRLWPTEGLSGQLSQEVALPSLFEAASADVTEDKVAQAVPCGPDPERHVAEIRKYLEAGFDEIYINQIGEDLAGFLRFFEREIAPRLAL